MKEKAYRAVSKKTWGVNLPWGEHTLRVPVIYWIIHYTRETRTYRSITQHTERTFLLPLLVLEIYFSNTSTRIAMATSLNLEWRPLNVWWTLINNLSAWENASILPLCTLHPLAAAAVAGWSAELGHFFNASWKMLSSAPLLKCKPSVYPHSHPHGFLNEPSTFILRVIHAFTQTFLTIYLYSNLPH